MELLKISFSILALIAVNLMPLVGVIWFGWDTVVIVLLYWTENIVIGFYNILKMVLVKVDSPISHLGKLFSIPFFCIHFGGFCAFHGLFLLIFFKLGGGMDSLFPEQTWLGPLVFLQLLISVVTNLWRDHPPGMEGPIIGLFISHGLSFFQNYLWNKEYASLTISELMRQPYKRILILHMAIVVGGLLIMRLDSPVPLLCILVLLKICMDIYLHMKEHRVEIREKIELLDAVDS